MSGWISRQAALQRLGIQAQSLYAYVSRGRIAASPDPSAPRRSLYNADDVAALAARRQRGRSRRAVASGAIAWGEPVLETAISTVVHGRLTYRGRDAVELAEHATLEDTAELLVGQAPRPVPGWTGTGPDGPLAWLAAKVVTARPSACRTEASLVEEAANLVVPLAMALGALADLPIHIGFAQAWSRPEAADAIRRALVLTADHKLNPSTFATRVAASTGASLPACLLAGLATFSGPRHGAAPAAALSFIRSAGDEGAVAAVRARLAEGGPLPGFGHPLYVGIDPRAAAIMDALPRRSALAALRGAVFDETGQEPNVDFATAALAVCHGLPDDAPIRLFSAARGVGWLAHAVEQATSGGLIRPRGRYVGPVAGG